MIKIDVRSGQALYRQIIERFKEKILLGEMKPDEIMPSIRTLAATLQINPNTIKKAYMMLEQEGFIYRVVGRGTFVSGVNKDYLINQRKNFYDDLSKLIDRGKVLGLAEGEVMTYISNLYK